jgi:outer membrane murein-binding lipoprotein Lpp
MKKSVLDVLRGKFLISEDSVKNWRFILFVSVLAVVMIAGSHNADKKVHEIARLNEEVKELRSEFVDVRSKIQQLKLESTIIKEVEGKGLFPSKNPPKKIYVAKVK